MSASLQTPTTKPLLSNGAYDKLKHTVAIVLPALAALYIGLAQIWHFPNPDGVAGTVAAVNTFLGVLLGFSTKSYNNSDARYAGEIQVSDSGDKKTYSLVVNGDPADLQNMDEATFKVNDTGATPIIKQ